MTATVSYDYSSQAQQEQHQSIKEQLSHHFLRLNVRCILMIDAAILRRRNNKPELIDALENRGVIKVPVAQQYLTDEFFPWLVPLDLSLPEDAQLFDESISQALNEIEPQQIKKGSGRLISGWLASNVTPEETAIHIGKSALQSNNGKDILLRYYDPAVAPLLWNILDSWQRQRMLGPVTSWYSVDGDGQLIKRAGLMQQTFQMSHSVSLCPESWGDIGLIAVINSILRDYRLNNTNAPRLDELSVFQTIMPALKRARDYPFKNKDDLIAYGMHALTISPDFDRHPDISRLLEFQRSKEDASYLDAISTVSDMHWENIRTSER